MNKLVLLRAARRIERGTNKGDSNMNQSGIGEVYLVAGVVVIRMGAAIAVQTYRLESVKAEYAEFKGGVEALGKAAEQAAKEKEAKDKLAKEKADDDKKRLTI